MQAFALPQSVAFQVVIPAAMREACGSQAAVREVLARAGLLPVTVQEERWQIDPLNRGLILHCRVPVPLEGVEP